MVTWETVDRMACALPEVGRHASYGGLAAWKVRTKSFAWERPLRTADLEALGDAAPEGPILGIRTPDLVTKDLLLRTRPTFCFTTPHFDGYPAVLVRLDRVDSAELEDLLVEAWLSRAPARLAREYREKTGGR